ncbi:hypothetical protein BDF14DRAFT_1882022 [Spinellus fusiger]|nr:hypothetical protein BDF14DRAFT_1882022 [Spinellus fusiger]
MDSANHNVLQFISAAAQALESRNGDDFAQAYSNGICYSTWSFRAPELIFVVVVVDELLVENESAPLPIQELLADATGLIYEESISTQGTLHKDKMVEDTHCSITEKIRIVFGLPTAEALVGEWPCYIIRSAIVPGCLYLTENHIFFFASLTHNQGYAKTGFLLVKMGSYRRCYFDIKTDILAWYENATDSYSPLGKVDLKYALSVRRSKKRKYGFRITTTTKTWHFKADTESAVIEWLNVLQKAIFKAKNNGTSLKLSISMENILDIELPDPIEFQQFLKIRTVGVDDSLVMDEYYFAYFPDINKAFNSLVNIWNKSQKETDTTEKQPTTSTVSSGSTDTHPTSAPNTAVSLTIGNTPEHKPRVIRVDPSLDDIIDSSSSGEEDQPMVDWLDEKRRSGLKLVYGLLSGNTGSASTALHQEEGGDDDEEEEEDGNEEISTHGEPLDERTRVNFRKYFVLPESEKLYAVYRCYLMKTLPCYGKLYISSNHLSFNSKGFATKARVIIPLQDVLRIQKVRNRGYLFYALSILTHTKKEIFLEFSILANRNNCFARLYLQHKWALENRSITGDEEQNIKNWEASLLDSDQEEALGHIDLSLQSELPILSQKVETFIAQKQPEKPLHITCITIGTRGDIQPYIALCKGLIQHGHRCRIATHDEFKDWIEEHDIEFRSIGGDPGELMRICVENSFFSVNFVREGLRLFKVWINELLDLTWKACEGTEMIIESPSAMVGIHMAEKLRVPYFRAFPMPMSRTRSFPHPFATPNSPKGRLYNDMTYILFDHAVWRAIATRTNNFRRRVLSLPATSYEKLQVWKIPYLYCFSQSVTGWKISDPLQAFIDAPDTRPIVYIGFGSIIVADPQEITRVIVEATLLSNVRAIVSRGWSSRLQDKAQGKTTTDTSLRDCSNDNGDALLQRYPDTIISLQSVPHDWLFPKLRAVVHHGGAGTTAAGLRAGIPTIVKPFFADQFFWGDRVEEMGVGLCIKQLTVESLSAALRIVSTDDRMLKTANMIGEKIRRENGVETAIQCIYRDMELAKERTLSSAQASCSEETQVTSVLEEDQEWTLIDSLEPISSIM